MISKILIVLAVIGMLVAFLVCMTMSSLVGILVPDVGVTITVYNNTDHTLLGVSVATTGSTNTFAEIEAGDSVYISVNPHSESDIVLSFTDPDGVRHEQEIGVYIERGYRGSVDIYIRPGWTVDWVDKIEI